MGFVNYITVRGEKQLKGKNNKYLPVNSCFLVYIAASKLKFTSQYQGKAVTGLLGSSVNLTWSFSGDLRRVKWGLKDAHINDIRTVLVSIDSTGLLPVPVPPAYSGRVTGVLLFDQAIFTLSALAKQDENLYGCQIESSNLIPIKQIDFVRLVVEGECFAFIRNY